MDSSDLPVGLAGDLVGAVQDDILNFFLQLVGELEALPVKDLNAIVLKGVVRSGDDDAGVGLLIQRHPGHRRRRDGSQIQHVGPGGAQPPNQRPFQQVAGDARILADGEQRPSVLLLF